METITLRACRVNACLSLNQATALLGISKDTLSSYERGITSPSVDILKRMEEVYDVRILNNTVNFLPKQSVKNGKKEV
jgi:predicted transcriptional regulator